MLRPHPHVSLCAAMIVLLVVGVSPTEGQEVNGLYEQLRSQVAVGDVVTIRDVHGRQMRGKITEISPSSVSLIVDKVGRTFLESDINTVSRRDSRWSGTLWGLAAGGVIGVWLDHGLVREYGREDISASDSAAFIGAAAAFGAGAGFAVDALIRKERPIYSRPAASTGSKTSAGLWIGRRKGAFVSLSF